MQGRLAFYTALAAIFLSVVFSARRLLHTPDESALDDAAAFVRRHFGPGDALILATPQMHGLRDRLGDLPWLDADALHADDTLPYARIFFLAQKMLWRAHQPPRALPGATLTEEHSWSGVALGVYQTPPTGELLFDLGRDIKALQVSVHQRDGVAKLCRQFDRDRWTCPGEKAWNYVGQTYLEVEGTPRRCVWLHPFHDGRLLRLEAAVKPSDRVILTGAYGFSDHAARNAQAPVTLRINTGVGAPWVIRHGVQAGWKRLRQTLDTGDKITIEVESTHPGAAHFCLDLKVVGAAP